jgi:hypothetical protein
MCREIACRRVYPVPHVTISPTEGLLARGPVAHYIGHAFRILGVIVLIDRPMECRNRNMALSVAAPHSCMYTCHRRHADPMPVSAFSNQQCRLARCKDSSALFSSSCQWSRRSSTSHSVRNGHRLHFPRLIHGRLTIGVGFKQRMEQRRNLLVPWTNGPLLDPCPVVCEPWRNVRRLRTRLTPRSPAATRLSR